MTRKLVDPTLMRRAVACGIGKGEKMPWRRRIYNTCPEFERWVEANPFKDISDFVNVLARIDHAMERLAGDLQGVELPRIVAWYGQPQDHAEYATIRELRKWAEQAGYILEPVVKGRNRSPLDGIYADLHIITQEADRWLE